MRKEYTREALSEADVDADPVVQFGRWGGGGGGRGGV
jgi:hypothetical protein